MHLLNLFKTSFLDRVVAKNKVVEARAMILNVLKRREGDCLAVCQLRTSMIINFCCSYYYYGFAQPVPSPRPFLENAIKIVDLIKVEMEKEIGTKGKSGS